MTYFDYLIHIEGEENFNQRLEQYIIELENIAATIGKLRLNLCASNVRETSDALAPLPLALYSITDALKHESPEIKR